MGNNNDRYAHLRVYTTTRDDLKLVAALRKESAIEVLQQLVQAELKRLKEQENAPKKL